MSALAEDAHCGGLIQNRGPGVSWLLLQQSGARRLHADGNGGQGVCQQVDKQQVHGQKRHWQAHHRGVHHAQNAGHVAGQKKLNGVFNVGEHAAPIYHRLYDGGKVIV